MRLCMVSLGYTYKYATSSKPCSWSHSLMSWTSSPRHLELISISFESGLNNKSLNLRFTLNGKLHQRSSVRKDVLCPVIVEYSRRQVRLSSRRSWDWRAGNIRRPWRCAVVGRCGRMQWRWLRPKSRPCPLIRSTLFNTMALRLKGITRHIATARRRSWSTATKRKTCQTCSKATVLLLKDCQDTLSQVVHEAIIYGFTTSKQG